MTQEDRTAALESRIAELEAALRRRSTELRWLQDRLDEGTLRDLDRLRAGRPPLVGGSFHPDNWRETTRFSPARVLPVLRWLWGATRRPEQVAAATDPDEGRGASR